MPTKVDVIEELRSRAKEQGKSVVELCGRTIYECDHEKHTECLQKKKWDNWCQNVCYLTQHSEFAKLDGNGEPIVI